MYAEAVARGQIPVGGDKLNFLVVSTDINQNTTPITLARKIQLSLNRELDKSGACSKDVEADLGA